jgi:putative Mg2+ transporter-C (MgtC) family protein
MRHLYPWAGDLHALPGLAREWAGLICILLSAACGVVIGMERERHDKPAGPRTLALIAVGSTIFTLVSLLLAAKKATADPARLAAQILPGIGFLGAGAIIQARGTVVGLTTGATIWAVAAVGVTVGSGYAVAGVGFTVLILFMLTFMRRLERTVVGACRLHRTTVTYRPERGKTRPRLQAILDEHRVAEASVSPGAGAEDEHTLQAWICLAHREHRTALRDIAELPEVVALQVEGG